MTETHTLPSGHTRIQIHRDENIIYFLRGLSAFGLEMDDFLRSIGHVTVEVVPNGATCCPIGEEQRTKFDWWMKGEYENPTPEEVQLFNKFWATMREEQPGDVSGYFSMCDNHPDLFTEEITLSQINKS